MKSLNSVRFAALVVALLLLLTGGAQAQLVREKAFGTATGHEEVGAMASVRTGGYLLAGIQHANTQPGQLYLLRLNAVGDTLWTRRYTVPGFHVLYVNHALEDAAGRVLLVGNGATYSGTTQTDAYLVLLSAQGDTLWTRRTQSLYQDNYSQPLLTPAGDFLLTANLAGAPQLLRIAPGGQVVQQVIVPYSSADLGQVGVLLPTTAGGYWVGSYNSAPPYVGKFIRFDAMGTRGIEMPIAANAPAIGNYVFDSGGYFVATGGDVTRLDANLNVLWRRPLVARGFPLGPQFIRPTPDGNFVVAGGIVTSSGGQDLGVVKISAAGQPLRDTVLIRPGNETLSGLEVAPGTGNYVIAGWSTSGPIGGADVFWAELRRYATVTPVRPGQPWAEALTAYPNPVGTDGRVQLATGPGWRGTLRLLDALGRPVRSWPGGALPPEVSVLGLPAGLYLLSATSEQGARQTLRLVRP